jgi:hypothetical protein
MWYTVRFPISIIDCKLREDSAGHAGEHMYVNVAEVG